MWRRLLTDPASGGLLDYGRTVYPPPRLLQEFVRVRDVTSVFPTDNTPAHRTETDHHLEWERGGPTSATNCGPLTGWINRAKTWYRWSALRLPDGGLRWTSPTGITADRPPTQVGPTDTEAREAAARLRQPSPGLDRRAANQAWIDHYRAHWEARRQSADDSPPDDLPPEPDPPPDPDLDPPPF